MPSEHIPAIARQSPFLTVSLAEQPDLLQHCEQIGGAAWPEFMLHDPVALNCWSKLIDYFPDDQLILLVDEKIVAIITMVPLQFNGHYSDLPDRGVDWGVEQAIADHESGRASNVMLAVQVVIPNLFQGQGWSSIATEQMIAHARRRETPTVLVPARPSQKHKFPLIPMDEYIQWTNENDEPYDGWLRTHTRLGGEIKKTCHRSMEIHGSLQEWETWTGLQFPGSGLFVVAGALVPIAVDKLKNEAVYHESNVWLLHQA